MAVEAMHASRSAHELTTRSIDLFQMAWETFRHQDPTHAVAAERILREVRGGHGPAGTSADPLMTSVADLLSSVRTMLHDGVPFTERAMREINSLFEKGMELLECARDALVTENRVLVRHILASGAQYSQLANDYAMAHQQRLVEGVCLPQASTVYLGMLEHLKGVGRHAHRVAEELSLRQGPAPAAR
jgi:hypothetical protein